MTKAAGDFPSPYKQGIDVANKLLIEGAERIVSICQELSEESHLYRLDIGNGVKVSITMNDEEES